MTDNYTTSDNSGVTSRPMTETEIATYLAAIADADEEKARQTKIQTDKATARASALTKLKALGLTDAEVAALVGG